MNGLRTAIGFLTRIPIAVDHSGGEFGSESENESDGQRGNQSGNQPVLAKAAPWFPVVGLGIGVLQGAVLLGLHTVIPPAPAAVLAVAFAALITGAFHHDGLADMADAFGGGWDVEQRMAILKDSRLGTYGTVALVLALATEISTLTVLEPADGFRAVVAAHCLSRAIAVAVMYRAPLAGDGLGAAYASDLGFGAVAVAMVVGVAATALAFAGGWLAVPALAAAVIAAAAVVWLAIRKIGGVTGDVLGAVQQLSALAVLVVATSAVSN